MISLSYIAYSAGAVVNKYCGPYMPEFLDDEQTWRSINNAIKKAFGLWFYKSERTGNIRCLCPSCLKDYMSNNGYVVKRLNPFAGEKDHCDKCDKLGYDYLVYDKKSGT